MSGETIISAAIGASGPVIVCIITIIANGKRRKIEIEEANKQLEQSIKKEIELNNKSLAVQYVTDKRLDWVFLVREELSNFISLSFRLEELSETETGNEMDKRLFSKLCCARNKALAQLRLLFNINDNLDGEIIEILNNITDKDYTKKPLDEEINLLTQKSKIYLKLEWERVKLEVESDLSKSEIKARLENQEKELREFFDEVNIG